MILITFHELWLIEVGYSGMFPATQLLVDINHHYRLVVRERFVARARAVPTSRRTAAWSCNRPTLCRAWMDGGDPPSIRG